MPEPESEHEHEHEPEPEIQVEEGVVAIALYKYVPSYYLFRRLMSHAVVPLAMKQQKTMKFLSKKETRSTASRLLQRTGGQDPLAMMDRRDFSLVSIVKSATSCSRIVNLIFALFSYLC